VPWPVKDEDSGRYMFESYVMWQLPSGVDLGSGESEAGNSRLIASLNQFLRLQSRTNYYEAIWT
jgi:hypothetical protein